MLTESKIIRRFRNLRLFEKIFLQGLLIVVVLIGVQLLLDNARESFMIYMPPLGFFFLMTLTYGIQPLIIGVLNIVLINVLFKSRGWQVGFWLNGIFLLLAFSTINLLLQTALRLSFSPYVVLIDVFLLSFPFGCVARFSNGGWKKPID